MEDGTELRFDHGAPYFTMNNDEVAQVMSGWEARGLVAEWKAMFVCFDRETGKFTDSKKGLRQCYFLIICCSFLKKISLLIKKDKILSCKCKGSLKDGIQLSKKATGKDVEFQSTKLAEDKVPESSPSQSECIPGVRIRSPVASSRALSVKSPSSRVPSRASPLPCRTPYPHPARPAAIRAPAEREVRQGRRGSATAHGAEMRPSGSSPSVHPRCPTARRRVTSDGVPTARTDGGVMPVRRTTMLVFRPPAPAHGYINSTAPQTQPNQVPQARSSTMTPGDIYPPRAKGPIQFVEAEAYEVEDGGQDLAAGGVEVSSQYGSSNPEYGDGYAIPNQFGDPQQGNGCVAGTGTSSAECYNQFAGNMPNNGYFTSVLNPVNNETFLEELVNQNEPSCGVNDQSSQPMPQSSVNPGKGSNKRTHNFNQEEDEMLCITWVNVCIDPIHGTDQSSATYWNRMLEYYNAHKKFAAVRNANSLQNRWSGIQAAVSRFSGCYSQIERANQSGVVIQDTVLEAKELYKRTHPKNETFKLEHCWRYLRDQPKWQDKEKEISQNKAPKRKKISVTDATPVVDHITDLDEPSTERPEGNATRRPIGNKRAKEALKGSASKDRVLAAFESIWEKKKEVDSKRDENFRLLYELEKEEFEHKRMLDDERIMTMDISNMSERQQSFYMRLREEIIQRRGLDGADV